MTKEQAVKKIAALVKQAEEKINEATKIADSHDVGFSWELAYGMGGYYDPEEKEWVSSSNDCW